LVFLEEAIPDHWGLYFYSLTDCLTDVGDENDFLDTCQERSFPGKVCLTVYLDIQSLLRSLMDGLDCLWNWYQLREPIPHSNQSLNMFKSCLIKPVFCSHDMLAGSKPCLTKQPVQCSFNSV
jgi:hypothetical protein